MPQLMPFVWIWSVFMSFLLLLVLVIVYNYIEKFYSYKLGKLESEYFSIKW